SARFAPRGRTPRSRSLLPFLQVLAGDIEEARPALSLGFYPIRGLGKRLRPQGEAVGPAVDHAAHDTCLRQRLQVPRDRRFRNAEVPGNLSDSRRSAAEPFDDVATERMRESLESIVSHSANYMEYTGAHRRTPDRRRTID